VKRAERQSVFCRAGGEPKRYKGIAAICNSTGIEVLQMRMAGDKFELVAEAHVP
jgi:hypothetical protein